MTRKIQISKTFWKLIKKGVKSTLKESQVSVKHILEIQGQETVRMIFFNTEEFRQHEIFSQPISLGSFDFQLPDRGRHSLRRKRREHLGPFFQPPRKNRRWQFGGNGLRPLSQLGGGPGLDPGNGCRSLSFLDRKAEDQDTRKRQVQYGRDSVI